MTIQPNQSTLDAVLSHYGSLEAAMDFCRSNGIPLSHLPAAGTQYNTPTLHAGYDASEALKQLQGNGIVIGTSGSDICGMVSGFSITELSSNAIQFAFAAGEGAVNIQWAYAAGDVPEAPAEIYFIAADATTLTLSALIPESTYTFFIRTRCYGTASPWLRTVFTTTVSYTMSMILYPGLLTVSMDVGLPAPSYDMYFDAFSATNIYPLVTTDAVPSLTPALKSDWDSPFFGYPALLEATLYGLDSAVFVIPSGFSGTEIYMWYSPPPGDGCTLMLIDEMGNKAETIPLILYGESIGTIAMQSLLNIGVGTSVGSLFRLPVYITSLGSNAHFSVADYRIKIFEDDVWEDLTGPLTIGVEVLLYLPVGTHKIGLFTTYQSSVLTTPPGPVSATTMILQIT